MSPTKRRAPGDGGLHKRKDNGLWVGSVEIPSADGKQRKKYVAAKDYKEAKRKLDDLRDEVRSGNIPVSSSTTVVNWLRYWVDTIKKPHVRPNTYDWYEEAIRLHIVPNLDPKLKLKQLTAIDIRAMLDKIGTSSNQQRAHKTLKLALKSAVTERYVGRNAADAVEVPGHIKKTRGALTAEAATLAIAAALQLEASRDEDTPILGARWVAAFLTGARPAELLGLEWDRVDLTNGVVDLAWQLQQVDQAHGCGEPDGKNYPCGKKRPSFCPQARWDLPAKFEYRECLGSLLWTRPKSVAGTRIVPLIGPLHQMLKQHHQQGGPNPHNLVWHRPDGHPLTRHDDAREWKTVLTQAQLPKVDIYAARHTTATLLQELGVGEEVRMQIMGQSSAAAHRGYIHVDQTQTRAALGRLESKLFQPQS